MFEFLLPEFKVLKNGCELESAFGDADSLDAWGRDGARDDASQKRSRCGARVGGKDDELFRANHGVRPPTKG